MSNPVVRSPAWGDSDSILIWKFAQNWWVIAADAGVSDQVPIPKVGSPANENWVIALKAIAAVTG